MKPPPGRPACGGARAADQIDDAVDDDRNDADVDRVLEAEVGEQLQHRAPQTRHPIARSLAVLPWAARLAPLSRAGARNSVAARAAQLGCPRHAHDAP